MSVSRQDGARAETTENRSGNLSVLEKAYEEAYPNRRKHLAIWGLREGLNWKYRQIAAALRVTEGHASRIHHLVQARIVQLGSRFPQLQKEFQTELALRRQSEADN
jgi:hypothetical protein